MQQLAAWHRTRGGLFLLGCLELAAAYGVASLAINSGALWEYLLGIVLIIASVRNMANLMRNLLHGHKTAKA